MKLLLLTTVLIGTLTSICNGEIGVETVSFGTLRLELQSTSSSEAKNLLEDLAARTTTFLDAELNKYFTSIQYDSFSHTGLGVIDFALDQTGDTVKATVDFDGSAYFTTDPTPGSKFIENKFKNFFQGASRLGYVRELQLSDTAFLADFVYLIVELNGQVIATEDLSYPDNVVDAEDDEGIWESNKILIIAGTCAGLAALCVSALLTYLCCCRRRSSRPKNLRVKTAGSNSTDAEDVESPVGKSPSPVHSICSQESSKFTYNPRPHYGDSIISTLSTDDVTLPSHFSQLNVDVDDILDVDAWARHSTISPITPAPFGNDISAIIPNQKDLSLIMETSNKQSTLASKKTKASSKLTHSALQDLDNTILNNDWNSKKGNEKSWYSEEENSYVGSSTSSDVINDLNNLSMQINRQRTKNAQPKQSSLYGPRND
jgi:hypothetical protein